MSSGAEFGICVPACMAAAITDVPAGTVTEAPSMVGTHGGDAGAGRGSKIKVRDRAARCFSAISIVRQRRAQGAATEIRQGNG